jgi:hypothetical protein
MIADSINPILALFTVIALVFNYIQKGFKTGNQNLVYCLLAVACVYLLRALDDKFKWWLSFALDYSTHTALSFTLTVCLSRLRPTFRIGWWIVWLMYLFLMVYQGYHGWMDILTTTIALVIPLFILHKIIDRRKKTPVS